MCVGHGPWLQLNRITARERSCLACHRSQTQLGVFLPLVSALHVTPSPTVDARNFSPQLCLFNISWSLLFSFRLKSPIDANTQVNLP